MVQSCEAAMWEKYTCNKSFNPFSPYSYWRTSQTSWGLTLPCTWTRSCSSCPCSSRPAGAACAPCPSLSRLPSALRASSSSDRETPCRPSTSCALGPWRSWKTTLCWPYWVGQRDRRVATDRKVHAHVHVVGFFFFGWKHWAHKQLFDKISSSLNTQERCWNTVEYV